MKCSALLHMQYDFLRRNAVKNEREGTKNLKKFDNQNRVHIHGCMDNKSKRKKNSAKMPT